MHNFQKLFFIIIGFILALGVGMGIRYYIEKSNYLKQQKEISQGNENNIEKDILKEISAKKSSIEEIPLVSEIEKTNKTVPPAPSIKPQYPPAPEVVAQPKILSCENKHYNMAFILLVKNPEDVTSDRLDKLNWIKQEFSKDFALATDNLASMDTGNNVYTITAQPRMFYNDELDQFNEITKEFYKTHNDNYDFISIYTAFSTNLNQQHQIVVQNIKGIGLDIFNLSDVFGSKGKLRGVNFMGSIDMYNQEKYAINGLLHETGHQWCCYVGDNFAQGKDEAKLEIIQQNMHFYRGLQCPHKEGCAMNADYWVPNNNDGTFRRIFSDELGPNKYHPFVLYFMGLLPKEDYGTEFQLYDAGLASNWNFEKAVPYKKISINDIIKIEEERKCISQL